jgi:hypothetical protein
MKLLWETEIQAAKTDMNKIQQVNIRSDRHYHHCLGNILCQNIYCTSGNIS